MTRYAYPEALDGLALDRSGLVEASAGTGKTFLLEHLFVHLLLRTDATADRLLVVTFTERATAELEQRIAARIEHVASHREDGARGWLLDEAARLKLAAARAALEGTTISTIHGFCQRVLTEQPFLTNRLIAGGPSDGAHLFASSFREVLRSRLVTEPSFAPYLEAWLRQGADVRSFERALRKARSLGVPLARPFSPARLVEAARVFLGATPEGCFRRHKHTLKGSSVTSLEKRLAALCEGVNAAFARPTEDTRAAALLAVLSKDQLEFFQFASGNEEAPRRAFFDAELKTDPGLALVQLATRQLFEAAPSLLSVLVERALPLVDAHLDARKLADGSVDFDDLIRFVEQGLEGPAGEALVANLRARYRFALVDEFQDTDPRQWRIFERIFFRSGAKNPLYLVGDPKQAIYGFRSADVHTYLAARDRVLAEAGSRLDLTANYRSSKPLVDALNLILDQDAASPYFQETPLAPAITYRPPATAGRDAVAPDEPPPLTLLRVEAAGGAKPPRMPDVKRALLWALALDLRGALDREPGLLSPERGVFVLTRTTAEMHEVGAMLAAHDIPHHFHREERLLSGEEAKDVLAVLQSLADPQDASLRQRAWLTPFFGLTFAELPSPETLDPFHPLLASLERWSRLAADRAFGALFAELSNETGLSRRLLAEGSAAGLRKLGAYRQLFAFLARLASRGHADLGALISRFEPLVARTLEPEDGEDDIYPVVAEARGVEVMTMHRAKGLEADRVYLYGGFVPVGIPRVEPVTFLDPGPETAEGGLASVTPANARRVLGFGRPSWKREQRAMKAERSSDDQRLTYVAMTRARRALVLPYFPSLRSLIEESWLESVGEAHDLFERLNGGYRHVNRRLDELQGDPAFAALTVTRPVTFPLPPEAMQALHRRAPRAPEELTFTRLAATGVPDAEAARFEARKRQSAGLVIASYTRLQGLRDALERAETDRETELADEAPLPLRTTLAPAATEEGTLAGGAEAGVLLHSLLELVPLGPPVPWDVFRADPFVLRLTERELGRHGRPRGERDAALRLVHTALTHPWPVTGRPLTHLAAAAKVVRELEFLYPVATEGGPGRGPTTLVKGFIDVLFEHDGRIHLADWKSDRLPDFAPGALAERVATHYGLQVRLYTRALTRMFGLGERSAYEARFGGMIFVFLRGLSPDGPPSEGMTVVRPTWEELQDEALDLGGL